MLASSREPCWHREALRGVEDAAPYKLQGKHCRESPGDVTGPAIMRRGGIHPARGTLPCREPLRASNARPYNRWKKTRRTPKCPLRRKPGGYGIRPYMARGLCCGTGLRVGTVGDDARIVPGAQQRDFSLKRICKRQSVLALPYSFFCSFSPSRRACAVARNTDS